MPDLSTYDINDGRTFIPQCLQDTNFRSQGVLYGNNNDLWWAMIDPSRFPLNVWKEQINNDSSYGETALNLGSIAFTNGPMMDRFTTNEVKRILIKQMILDGLNWAAIGAVIGFLFGVPGALFGAAIGLIGGAALGYYAGRKQALEGWQPYGRAFGKEHNIEDEGVGNKGYVYLGRKPGTGFSIYEVSEGEGVLDADAEGGGFEEIFAGLIPLVRHFAPSSKTVESDTFHSEYAKLTNRDGLAAWALVPFNIDSTTVDFPNEWGQELNLGEWGTEVNKDDLVVLGQEDLEGVDLTSTTGDGSEMGGVIIVVGNPDRDFIDTIASTLSNIGARDAVAMDGSNSAMMGAQGEFFFGPPPSHKQLIQKYGFYCG